MTSREKLLQLRKDFYLNKPVDYDSVSYFTTIEKDLEILEDFIKLFEGEDLEGWIEFNFGYTLESEDSIDNYNGFVSLLKRIKNYLEGVKK